LGLWNVLYAKDFRAAVFVEPDCFHGPVEKSKR
jgi:hypothetical protein